MTSLCLFRCTLATACCCVFIVLCALTMDQTRGEIHEEVFGIHLDDDVKASATCVWYGSVKVDVNGTTKSKTRYYNGKAIVVEEKFLPMVWQYCHEFLNGTETALCCDTAQLAGVNAELMSFQQMFLRCPACFDNFRKFICTYNCSPYQSLFMNVTSTVSVPGSDIIPDDKYFSFVE